MNISSTCSIPRNAIWEGDGVVVAGRADQCGSDLYSLCLPYDIFIDNENNKLYIVDTPNNRIVLYSSLINDSTTDGIIVANQGLIYPTSIFVDIRMEDMYILDYNKNETKNLRYPAYYRVQLWHKNDTISKILVNESGKYNYSSSSQIILDKQLNIYINTRFHIRKCFSSTNYKNCINIAGINEQCGQTSNDLCGPRGFYLHENLTIFIVDTANKRILKWFANSLTGEILVKTIAYTAGITSDCHDRIYWGAYKAIFQYDPTNNQTKIIIGGNEDIYLLWMVSSLKFDKFGNLFVADFYRNRIKKFSIL
ncbi:unnamed protein product [Rotaria sordida]|uniref:Uncharacterized protein n=1 Tax=Rotaria sordida TaxID=392033 RepID=A0A814WMV4_9BILA|nr:unnamed protein product [Rotaria sordida]CAF3972731.1 unnamed protein product [Rotaria sordida]